MAGVVYTKLLEALKGIGVDVSQQSGSNVKTLATKNKSTSTKPGLLAAERDTGGNFATVLDIFKKDAQYIDGMNDVEQMAFLNNIMDYKEFGGSSIKNTEGIRLKDEFDKGLGTLKDDIESLQSTAKTMKDEADAGLASAEKDLKDFLDTGGQPLKAKSDKYLGGSMHEEGQLRTAIRTFLKNEYKNGRIKLDKDDQFRIMEYSPMMEDDSIKVFKKIYGEEAYTKAGTFPGAFEKGENFNHYESIFKENMGVDILKVKDKKYVGDGKLVLTKQEEVVTPTPDEDMPFAKGGRASFVGGKFVDELVAMLVKKEPMEAMKEVNKIIGKKGKYKNLTQKDIDRIVDQTNDHIFQRDPDNLYVGDRDIDNKKRLLTDDEIRDYEAELGDSETWMMDGTVGEAEKALADSNEYMAAMKKEYDAASPAERAEVIGSKEPVEDRPMFKQKKEPDTQIFKDSEGGIKGITMGGDAEFKKAMSEAMDEGIKESENMKRLGLDPSKKGDFDKYEKMKADGQLEKNVTEEIDISQGMIDLDEMNFTKNAQAAKKAIDSMSDADLLMKKYPGMGKELAEQIAKDPDPARKAQVIAMVEQTFELSKQGKSGDEIIDIFKKGTDRTEQADGGITKLRNGYYGGGMTNMIEPDLSDIGHGSDALMGRTRLAAPGSQATTSTGLNYLLGEDNDNVRIPFRDGKTYKQKLEEEIKKRLKYKRQGMEFDKPLGPDGTFNTGNPPMRYAVASGGRIPFNEGLLVPPPKPYTEEMFQDDSMTLLKGMYGTGKDSNEFLYNEMIKKGNKLRERGVERETVIEIIRNNKDKIDMILKQQTTSPKSLAGLADGGRIKFQGGGGADASTTSFSKSFDKQHGTNTVSRANKTVDARQAAGQRDADITNERMQNTNYFVGETEPSFNVKAIDAIDKANNLNKFYNFATTLNPLALFKSNPYAFAATGILSLNERRRLKKLREEQENSLQPLAEGGVAGLRQGYAGGKGVDITRRGFLKFLGGTAAGVAALKTGLVKMFGKESGAISKKTIDEVIIEGGSGAPAWLQPLVNKALREGTDISKQAVKDGQVVKSLDTPTGKVDVYYDTRTGEIDIDYIGGNTALGESVNMRYVPGVADEGTKGVKPMDEFEANEAIPQLDSSSGNFSGSHQTAEMGENVTSDVKGLYSDTSELAELGGQKPLIKDISESIKKKKVLKKMNENPDEFAMENASEYYE